MIHKLLNFIQKKRINKLINQLSDVQSIMSHAEEKHIINSNTNKMIKGVLNISNLKVRDIMIS